MPDPYTPVAPNPPWYELDATSARPLQTAFRLLELTFPHRYLHLDLAAVRRKMLPTRDVASINQPPTHYLIRSLRVFTWNEPNVPTNPIRIAAFFFLRLFHRESTAYSLSVGIDDPTVAPAFTADDLY